MPTFRDPLKRHTFLMVQDYDKADIIVENAISKKRIFQDAESNIGLTAYGNSNTILMDHRTRVDEARDVTLHQPRIVGRIEKYHLKDVPGRYHNHGGTLL